MSETIFPVNTHERYKTVGHTHVDYFFPDRQWLELLVIECEDGRWYVEGGWTGKGWEEIDFICLPDLVPFREPVFVSSRKEAVALVAKAFNQVYGVEEDTIISRYAKK